MNPANDTALRSGNGILRFGRLARFGRGGRPDGKAIKPGKHKRYKSTSSLNNKLNTTGRLHLCNMTSLYIEILMRDASPHYIDNISRKGV